MPPLAAADLDGTPPILPLKFLTMSALYFLSNVLSCSAYDSYELYCNLYSNPNCRPCEIGCSGYLESGGGGHGHGGTCGRTGAAIGEESMEEEEEANDVSGACQRGCGVTINTSFSGNGSGGGQMQGRKALNAEGMDEEATRAAIHSAKAMQQAFFSADRVTQLLLLLLYPVLSYTSTELGRVARRPGAVRAGPDAAVGDIYSEDRR